MSESSQSGDDSSESEESDTFHVPSRSPKENGMVVSKFRGKFATDEDTANRLQDGSIGPAMAVQLSRIAFSRARAHSMGHHVQSENPKSNSSYCEANPNLEKGMRVVGQPGCPRCTGLDSFFVAKKRGIRKRNKMLCRSCNFEFKDALGRNDCDIDTDWTPLSLDPYPLIILPKYATPEPMSVREINKCKKLFKDECNWWSEQKREDAYPGYEAIGQKQYGRKLEEFFGRKDVNCDCCGTFYCSASYDHHAEKHAILSFFPKAKRRTSSEIRDQNNPGSKLCWTCHMYLTINGPIKTALGWAVRVEEENVSKAFLYVQSVLRNMGREDFECEHRRDSELLNDLCPHTTSQYIPLPQFDANGNNVKSTIVHDHVSLYLY